MNTYVKALSTVLLIIYYWLESMVLAFIPKSMRSKDVSKETVLITGAGSGIGRLLAVRFAKLGARLVLWDVNKVGNEETAKMVKDIGAEAYHFECDISDRECVYKTAARVKDEVGIVTILVNNAGIITGKRLLDCPDHMIQKTFEVNCIAHFWTVKAFLGDMIEANHGHIVSISSLAGLAGSVRLGDYCASKFGVIGFHESLTMELHAEGHTGIHTTAVCPFFINTGMFTGVDTKVFNILKPEYVADQIMGAVLSNQYIIMIPKSFYVLYALKSIMPITSLKVMFDSLGGSKSMNTFVGRNHVKAA